MLPSGFLLVYLDETAAENGAGRVHNMVPSSCMATRTLGRSKTKTLLLRPSGVAAPAVETRFLTVLEHNLRSCCKVDIAFRATCSQRPYDNFESSGKISYVVKRMQLSDPSGRLKLQKHLSDRSVRHHIAIVPTPTAPTNAPPPSRLIPKPVSPSNNPQLTHSPTHPPTHPLTHPLTHPPTPSPTHSLHHPLPPWPASTQRNGRRSSSGP